VDVGPALVVEPTAPEFFPGDFDLKDATTSELSPAPTTPPRGATPVQGKGTNVGVAPNIKKKKKKKKERQQADTKEDNRTPSPSRDAADAGPVRRENRDAGRRKDKMSPLGKAIQKSRLVKSKDINNEAEDQENDSIITNIITPITEETLRDYRDSQRIQGGRYERRDAGREVLDIVRQNMQMQNRERRMQKARDEIRKINQDKKIQETKARIEVKRKATKLEAQEAQRQMTEMVRRDQEQANRRNRPDPDAKATDNNNRRKRDGEDDAKNKRKK
jgi:hypothetical protein